MSEALTPFYRDATGALCFDGQGGRTIIHGYSFESNRGYRVFVGFEGSPARNTISFESARRIASKFFGSDDFDTTAARLALEREANRAEMLNILWREAGKPARGLADLPMGGTA